MCRGVVNIRHIRWSRKESNISIGHIRRDFFIGLWQTEQATKETCKVADCEQQCNIRKVQGTVNTDRNEVQSDNKLLKIVSDLFYTLRGRQRADEE